MHPLLFRFRHLILVRFILSIKGSVCSSRHEACTSKYTLATFSFSVLTPHVAGWLVRSIWELVIDSHGEVPANVPELMINASWQGN